MANKNYYVYLLIDSSTNIPFYVGKGTSNRMKQHERDAVNETYPNHRSVHAKIRKMLSTNVPIKYEQHCCNNENEAFELECKLITHHGRKDLKTGPLCNLTDGGEGARNQSYEAIRNRADKHIGSKRSAEGRANMSRFQSERKLNGYVPTEQTKELQRQNKIKRGKDSAETVQKRIRSRVQAVIQYSLDGEFIADHDCLASAARAVGAARSSMISNCCTQLHEQAHGYVWKYKNAKDNIICKSILRPVYQIDPLTNITIKQWDTVQEAAAWANITRYQLLSCCKGRYKTGSGWIWKFADDKPLNMSNKKIVHQLDMRTEEIIATWESTHAAAAALSGNFTGIVRCCSGQLKTSHGFKWKYADEIITDK